MSVLQVPLAFDHQRFVFGGTIKKKKTKLCS